MKEGREGGRKEGREKERGREGKGNKISKQ
jgi:hypothetical protein